MGGSTYSDDHYRAAASYRAANNIPTFQHDAAIRSGKSAAKAHESLDPSKLKAGKRESRDSDAHPESNAVFVGLDVTGSMREVPKMIQAKLPTLMGLLLRKGYLTDPAICCAAIGDVKFDRAPLQIGQFESGIEIETDITNLYLEGGGGGNGQESYDLALYFLARCTSCDCYEKRDKKGYAFIICDEDMPPSLHASEVERVFGHKPEADIPIITLLEEVLERWELYCIIPKMTSYYGDPKYSARWRSLLGERVLHLEDPDGISEMIASTIGVLEDQVDLDGLVGDLTSEGSTEKTANAVTKALATVGAGKGGLSKVTDGDTGLSTL